VLAYVFFDLVHQPYCGFEYRVAELLDEMGCEVFTIPRHRCLMEGRIPIPNDISCIYTSNPMALDVAVKVKETTHKPLICQFLDVPEALFTEDWRLKEYETVKELVKEADLITTISETTAKDVLEWVGKDCPEVKTNYIGVDVDLFQAFKPTDGDYICAVTRGLAKQKQHTEIIEAVEKSTSKPPLKIIYGQYSDIQKAKVMSRCLLGVGASRLEGYGLYVTEMGYYYKPFICRRLPVFEEIYGNSLIYVETSEQMANKIDWLVNDQVARTLAGSRIKHIIEEKKLFLHEHAKRLSDMLEGKV